MKKILYAICLFTFTYGFTQSKKIIHAKIDEKITSISYSVSSVKELEAIDWKSVKEIFSDNKKNEKIKMSFELDLKESKNNFKDKFSVGGTNQEIDSLIVKAKKGINGLLKLANKYENN